MSKGQVAKKDDYRDNCINSGVQMVFSDQAERRCVIDESRYEGY